MHIVERSLAREKDESNLNMQGERERERRRGESSPPSPLKAMASDSEWFVCAKLTELPD